MTTFLRKFLRPPRSDSGNTIPAKRRRRSSLRTFSAGSVLVLLLALVAPTTSATAEAGGLEESLMTKFFVDDTLSSASTPTFPACVDTAAAGEETASKQQLFNYRSCVGEVKTWDGLELDARVTFPKLKATSGPLPLVVLLHGWGGIRNGVHGTGPPHPGNDPNNVLSPARFWQKGYATLAYTARGFYASCGALDPAADVHAAGGTDVPSADGCHPQGHTHIAERRFEVADTQRLLGLLVDAGVADPQRLAATGESYGAGQSWMLATAMPWKSPAGTSLQLAAAAPFWGWSDLYGALAPNGRATDGVDQRASHEQPFGVVKQRWVNDAYRGGRAPVAADPALLVSGGRYNTTYPEELHSYFDGWMAVFNAGEPHATKQAQDLPAAFRGKSAYYPVPKPENPLAVPEKDYLTELAARRVLPVPIFAVQGWTDFVFPAVEALQMYRKLKASHAGYPIHLLIGDLGHGSQAPPGQKKYAWRQVVDFIDTHLGVGTNGVPAVAASFSTLCVDRPPGQKDPPLETVPEAVPEAIGENWDTLVKQNPLTFSSADKTGEQLSLPGPLDEPRTTNSVSSDIEEEMASDPIANSGRCIERPGKSSASGAYWRWAVGDEFTMLGLPSVTLPYAMTGEDATVVVKLWDVAPGGETKRLVTRGVYRLSSPGKLESSGSFTSRLFGNHWLFEEGHTIELEVGQLDRPFLRPDNYPSTITYSGVNLSVPQAKT